MRRLLAMTSVLILWASVVLAADPVTQPATLPATTQATRPATTQTATTRSTTRPTTRPTSRPTTRATTQADPGKAAEDAASLAALNALAGEGDATAELTAVRNRFVSTDVTNTVDFGLPSIMQDVLLRVSENEQLLKANPSLELLRQQQSALTDSFRQLTEWDGDLDERRKVLADITARLQKLSDVWFGKSKELETRRDALVANNRDTRNIDIALDRVDPVLKQVDELYQRVVWEDSRARDLRITISTTRSAASETLKSITDAMRLARDRLLTQDSQPLWMALLHPTVQGDVAEQGRNSFSNQQQALLNYIKRQYKPIFLHAAGVFTLAAVLIWLRRRTRQWVGNDPNLAAATRVFQTPIATAITASMILTPWIYPGAPRLFWGLLGTSALIPTIMVLRPLIQKSLRPLLYGLAAAIFLNLVISVFAALPLLARSLQLVQMGGASVFFLWFLRTGRGDPADPSRPGLPKGVILCSKFGLAITVVASLANFFGFVSLSRLIGNALLTSAYLGVLLDTAVHVADALLLGLSHVRPLNDLGMVQRHRPLLLKRLHLLMTVLGVCLWGFFTLDALTIRQPIFDAAAAVWYFPNSADEVRRAVPTDATGAVPNPAAAEPSADAAAATHASHDSGTLLYVGGIFLFIFSIVASIYTARFIAFLLDEDVYPRLNLARGMPYAISTLLRYTVLAIGFSLAIVNLGYGDPTKLTILVSAFSIGLGFGLQNIVNNFVSGLILLFERPVQVGDVIEMDNVTGVVSRIGIRASVIRTPLAAEIIVPNGRLISDRVVNWTLSNRQRGVELSLTVAAGVEPHKLIQLLVATAKGIPLVAAYPAPQAYFSDFSGGGMKFDVRVWTNRFEDWSLVRSELAVAINAMLVKENIPLK